MGSASIIEIVVVADGFCESSIGRSSNGTLSRFTTPLVVLWCVDINKEEFIY